MKLTPHTETRHCLVYIQQDPQASKKDPRWIVNKHHVQTRIHESAQSPSRTQTRWRCRTGPPSCPPALDYLVSQQVKRLKVVLLNDVESRRRITKLLQSNKDIYYVQEHTSVTNICSKSVQTSLISVQYLFNIC